MNTSTSKQDKITTALVAGGSAYLVISQDTATTLVGKLGATGLTIIAAALALRLLMDGSVAIIRAVSEYRTARNTDKIKRTKANVEDNQKH